MPAVTDGINEVLRILKELTHGVKSLVQIPENERKMMRDAIADTAELIDESLTIVKQHLTTVVSELYFGDRQKAKQMIYELGNFQGWEARYRQFQLCDSLRLAVDNLEKKGVFKIINNFSFDDPRTIHQRMFDYIGGETNAANSVGTMLQDLSKLAFVVDTEFDNVVQQIENARAEVGKFRQAFIDLEIEIRNSI
ncbi:MAG: hypothetical protein JNK09_05690 [Prolixibacteraceae bacterium]|nr:hypothetical protein [Prolixibacteraceae bacterium]